MARAVDGVEEALRLRPPPTLVFNASSDGREDAGVGECAREEAMEGRGEDNVDMMKVGGEWKSASRARRPDQRL